MIVKNQSIEVKITKKNIDYYKSLGYNCNLKDYIYVKAEDLTEFSMKEIAVECDICHNIYYVKKSDYSTYKKKSKLGKDDFDCCKECKHIKVETVNLKLYGVKYPSQSELFRNKAKETTFKKYGVENYSQTQECKEKVKKTCIERFGVENFSCTEECKNKVKETNIKKFGTEFYSQTQECKDRIKKTCLEKYGKESFTQTEEFKEKTKETVQNKYGVDFYVQSDEYKKNIKNTLMNKYGVDSAISIPGVQDKIKKTNIERYGVDNPLKSDVVKEKIKNTCLEKYGTEYYCMSEDFAEKYKNTCLKKYGTTKIFQLKQFKNKAKQSNLQKYGYECVFSSPEIRKRIGETLIKNNKVKTSSQQEKIYEILKSKYINSKKNYPCDNSFFDIALFIHDIKIDVEYDGSYWHQDFQRDRRRDEHFKSKGWKILRIRSGRKIPTEEQLINAIDELISTDRMFKEIILDDWNKNMEKVGEVV